MFLERLGNIYGLGLEAYKICRETESDAEKVSENTQVKIFVLYCRLTLILFLSG